MRVSNIGESIPTGITHTNLAGGGDKASIPSKMLWAELSEVRAGYQLKGKRLGENETKFAHSTSPQTRVLQEEWLFQHYLVKPIYG